MMMIYNILILSFFLSSCYSLTVKDLLPCKDTNAPMINSVVLVNCTDEPCFFGKDNGLSMQFIITPEKPAATVSSQITAEDIWGKEYLIDAKQRTSCAYSYCQLEPKVPRCFSSVVRRKKQPSENVADMYRFRVEFLDQNKKMVACSRFLLATYIKLKKTHKPVYSSSYKPYVYAPAYSAYSNYKPSYAQVSVELPKPSYSYSNLYGYDAYRPPYATTKDDEGPPPQIVEASTEPVSAEMEEEEDFRQENSTEPISLDEQILSEREEMTYLEDVPNIYEGEIEEEVPPFDDFARGKGLIFNETDLVNSSRVTPTDTL